MKYPERPDFWGRIARIGVLGAGAMLLTGCATGYSFVQPGMAGSGGYYTNDGAYAGQGSYGTGPYYPDTGGWGYYGGTWPYSDPYGWYGGYGYGSSLTFGFGFSNVWGFPGYWGPWYSSNWGCRGGYGCGDWRHHHHRAPDPDKPRPWLKPDHPPLPPRITRGSGSAPPIAVPARPVVRRPAEGFVQRRSLESTAFAPHDFVRAPIRRPIGAGIPAMPGSHFYVPPPPPTVSTFAGRRPIGDFMAAPRAPQPVAQPAFRSPPPAAAPRVAPPPRRDRHSRTEIP
jgi:hypothetical protein